MDSGSGPQDRHRAACTLCVCLCVIARWRGSRGRLQCGMAQSRKRIPRLRHVSMPMAAHGADCSRLSMCWAGIPWHDGLRSVLLFLAAAPCGPWKPQDSGRSAQPQRGRDGIGGRARLQHCAANPWRGHEKKKRAGDACGCFGEAMRLAEGTTVGGGGGGRATQRWGEAWPQRHIKSNSNTAFCSSHII